MNVQNWKEPGGREREKEKEREKETEENGERVLEIEGES